MSKKPTNFIEFIEYKLDKARLYKKVSETEYIIKKKKKTKALEDVNAEIREFAESKLLELQNDSDSSSTETNNILNKEVSIEKKVPIRKESVGAGMKETSHRDRKKVKTDAKQYPFTSGEMAKLATTESLTAVNALQAQKFIIGDEIKIMKCYTNQFDDDVAEILKVIDGVPVKGIISVQDLESKEAM